MQRRLIAICAAIAALAVVPSFASANPILTEPTGTALAGEPTLTATNIGNISFVTNTGTLTCTTASMTGRLLGNATAAGFKSEISAVKIGGTGAVLAGAEEPECTGSNFFTPSTTVTPNTGLPWCLEGPANADTFTIKGGKCGVPVGVKFSLDVTGVGVCAYERAGAINGGLITDGEGANENTFLIAGVAFNLVGGPGLCPAAGNLNMRFGLETDTETHPEIDISA